LGEKTGAGFYKRVDGEIYTLDYSAMEYRPRRKVTVPVVETAQVIADPAKRLRALVTDSSPAGEFVWRLLSSVLVYAARRVPDIARPENRLGSWCCPPSNRSTAWSPPTPGPA